MDTTLGLTGGVLMNGEAKKGEEKKSRGIHPDQADYRVVNCIKTDYLKRPKLAAIQPGGMIIIC
jgi:hypothetical protein